MPSGKVRSERPRTTTSYAILGLLSVRSWTTYELAKQVQRSLNWFWPRAERKLYDEPKALVADGLAEAVKEFTGQRPRTVYAITPEGRAALRAWLGERPAPRATEFEAMLKVFFADAGDVPQLLATIDAVEQDARERVEAVVALAEQGSTDTTPFPQRRHISALALRAQFEQEASVLRWARWAREQVPAWRSTTDAGRWRADAALAELVRDGQALLEG